jgi:nitroimidazol reductase NimA-like FMN-containing flavoprotein (pyridoxamine 5'-phosphate oxidase superfamily)
MEQDFLSLPECVTFLVALSSRRVQRSAKERIKMLKSMKALVREKDICVLATISGTKPHCSLMAYATNDSCLEIYMVTHRRTTKYQNLTENPNVSLLIDTREEHHGAGRPHGKALTVSGTFEPIADVEKRKEVRAKLLERHPHLWDFMNDPDAEPICIKVISFLLLDGLTDAHFENVQNVNTP